MKESVYAALKPVKGRQQLAFVTKAAAWGFVAGALVGYALGAGRIFLGWSVSWQAAAAVLAAGPVLGLVIGLALRRSWKSAAAAVDHHYNLKDRAVTALEFVNKTDPTELHGLQINDALDHLKRIEPKKVVPLPFPQTLPVGVAACALAAIGLFWPLHVQQAGAEPKAPAPDHVVAEADRIIAAATNIEEVARENEDRELLKVVEEMKKKAEELKQDGVDEREALAKLSELQSAIQAQMAQFNQTVMEGQLGALGAALAIANAFEGAGKALMEAKLDKAVQELEKLEEVELTPKEAKALEEKLKQIAKEAGGGGPGGLGGAIGDLIDNLKGGKGAVGKATKKLAKAVDAVRRRKRVNDLLEAELENLKEGKANFAANGGPKGRMPEKSTSPSSTWGRGISGNTQGEKTKLPSTRNQVELTGTPGEGDSEIETTTSPEARQLAGRSYKERYQKFRKESEAVLEAEAIPLGQRQMIRRYFEAIRPTGSGEADKPEKPQTPEKSEK